MTVATDVFNTGVGGSGSGAVDSVNGQTGVVVLTAADVGAQAAGADIQFVSPSVNITGYTGAAGGADPGGLAGDVLITGGVGGSSNTEAASGGAAQLQGGEGGASSAGTAGSGGSVNVTGGDGASSPSGTPGLGGYAALNGGNGGSTDGAEDGGAGGAVYLNGSQGGTSNGGGNGGAAGTIFITAADGGNANAGTGNGGNGGNVITAAGAGGSSSGGSPGIDGVLIDRSLRLVAQGEPSAQTVSATLTVADLRTGIITVNPGSSTPSALELPLASALSASFRDLAAGDSFDFSVINISTDAAETATLTTNTGWAALVGSMVVLPYSAAGVAASGRFRARYEGVDWTLYRLA